MRAEEVEPCPLGFQELGSLRGVRAGFRFSSHEWMPTGKPEHLFRLDRLLCTVQIVAKSRQSESG